MNDDVMKNRPEELKPEQSLTPEYSYEQGLSEIINFIKERLKNQPYIVVAFSASGQNVGKTTLAFGIQVKLEEQGFLSVTAHSPDELQREVALHSPDELQKKQGRKQMVFIIDQMLWGAIEASQHQELRKYYDQKIKTDCEEFGYEVNGIDLWVGIHTPNQPFATKMMSGDQAKPIADIIIKNTKAKRP